MTAVCVGGMEELLFVEDANSGCCFLVDSGLQRSVLRYVTVCFNGRQVGWDFVMALVSVPILGADFLCMHRLLVDMANRRPRFGHGLLRTHEPPGAPCLLR